jgi:hypothetical protein
MNWPWTPDMHRGRHPIVCAPVVSLWTVAVVLASATAWSAEPPDDGPSLAQTQRKVLQHAKLADSIDKWRARARLSNLVPYVDAETSWLDQRDTEHRFQEDHEADDTGTMQPHDTRNRRVDDERFRQAYGIQLEWDLSGLVFDRREIYILREQRQRQQSRTELLVRTTDLYLRRERAMRLLAADDLTDDRIDKLLFEQRRATAILDGLTDGWFRQQLD